MLAFYEIFVEKFRNKNIIQNLEVLLEEAKKFRLD
jgi:hypothetical protein